MPFQPSDLAAIDAVIAEGGGVLEVQYTDRTVTYRSMQDMLLQRTLIANGAASNGAPQQTRIVRVYTNSGWGGGDNGTNF